MQLSLVLAVCLLAQCSGLPTAGFLARQTEGTPLSPSSAASLRLRTEVAAYAQALGHLLDMAGIPMALRVPAARTIINRDADRLEQLHGHTVGAETFRRRMPHMVPDSMMYYSSPRQDPRRGAETPAGIGGEKVFTSSRVTTEGSEIMKDGQGRFTVRTTTCVNGECTRSNKTVDRTGAGHITPKAPLATIGRLMAGMSGMARRLEEEMEHAGPDLFGAFGGMPEGGEGTPSTDDEVTPSEDARGPMADSFDPFRAMREVMGHSPLEPLAASFNPFKEMMDTTGPGPRQHREEPRPSRAARVPLSAHFDPFEGLKTPGFGGDFGDFFGDFFGEPSEGPSEEPSEERPFQDLIHHIFEDMSGGASRDVPGDVSGSPGDVSEHQERSSTVTRIENGRAVQEIKRCKDGKCVTERHEYDVPADQLGGQPRTEPSPTIPFA